MLPIPNPDVIYRSLAEGAVLFSTRDEVYFGLNDVGARVWELLPPAAGTVDEICEVLADRYPDASPATIREDVDDLLAALAEHGLVLKRSEEPEEHDAAETTARAANVERR